MNWRIRMSLRLLGMAQRKNSAVTRKNGNMRPAGISCASTSFLFADGLPDDPAGMVKANLPLLTGRCGIFSTTFSFAAILEPENAPPFVSNLCSILQIEASAPLQHMPQPLASVREKIDCNLLRRALGDNATATFPAFRAQIDHPIGTL